ncbi:putative reverse transcriptase domain-containing protein [Tanacetum coccineum]
MWPGLIRLGLLKRESMLEIYPCATNASFTIMGRALQSARTVKELVIWPEIVGVPLLLTLRDPLELFRRRTGNGEARGRAYALGGGEPNPDSNIVTGTFLLNNRYASILFDTSADRTFVSKTFSSLIDITPSTFDNSYDVEIADERITGVNAIRQVCTLNLLNHPFNIYLKPVELGSFDAIIGMDWLTKYHVMIVCDEKIDRIPYGDEVLIVQGDKSDGRNESRLNIISCTKTPKYLLKGCHVFLERITEKKTGDKSEEKRPEDVPVVQDFLEVFPGDLRAFYRPDKWSFRSTWYLVLHL